MHVTVRVDVRDGHAPVAQERQLRLGLARDLLDGDPPEEGAAAHLARREEAAVRPDQAVEPGRVGKGLVEPVGDEREVDAEAEVGGLRAYSTAASVAGMFAMIDAPVSAPRSKHSIVASTVSSEPPKSSAFTTIRIGSPELRLCRAAERRPADRVGAR